ncbi:hypothetical protein BWZ22_05915 [Seonamhaeicola sp. S2-3]|uniref:DUF4199 domain-containing protein n=1 Tax=Seonamhaeicola sp. S2-3 TaxID=1936081 RepID=UPI000972C4B8|nr:DUF4199 domain-containing protein [Seonamhaeicola sp. S2-3]APY10801.1 hypothetical protein BWZ22_05915 [Seonamhaeicola sp. S2-3]
MKSTIFKYGLYGLLVGLIIFLIHLTLGKDLSYSTNEILGYISIFISLSFVFFGIKHYRDNVNNGVISLGKALIIGVFISVLVAIGIGIADFIYTQFINPDWFENYYQMMRDAGKENEIIEMSSLNASIFMVTLVTVIGFIISLISGLILQRK